MQYTNWINDYLCPDLILSQPVSEPLEDKLLFAGEFGGVNFYYLVRSFLCHSFRYSGTEWRHFNPTSAENSIYACLSGDDKLWYVASDKGGSSEQFVASTCFQHAAKLREGVLEINQLARGNHEKAKTKYMQALRKWHRPKGHEGPLLMDEATTHPERKDMFLLRKDFVNGYDITSVDFVSLLKGYGLWEMLPTAQKGVINKKVDRVSNNSVGVKINCSEKMMNGVMELAVNLAAIASYENLPLPIRLLESEYFKKKCAPPSKESIAGKSGFVLLLSPEGIERLSHYLNYLKLLDFRKSTLGASYSKYFATEPGTGLFLEWRIQERSMHEPVLLVMANIFKHVPEREYRLYRWLPDLSAESFDVTQEGTLAITDNSVLEKIKMWETDYSGSTLR